MDRKVQITTSKDGIKSTKTYNHFNTDLTDSDCVTFATNLNALSSRTLKQVARVDKEDITNAAHPLKLKMTSSAFETSFWQDMIYKYVQLNAPTSTTLQAVIYDGNAMQIKTLTSYDPSTVSVESDSTITFTASGTISQMSSSIPFTDAKVCLYEIRDKSANTLLSLELKTDSTKTGSTWLTLTGADIIELYNNLAIANQTFVNKLNALAKAEGLDAVFSYENGIYTITTSGDVINGSIPRNYLGNAFSAVLAQVLDTENSTGVTTGTESIMGTTYSVTNFNISKE